MPKIRLATTAEACVLLGCSVRTVERRIARGDLQTERDAAGRVRVRVEVPDDVDAVTSVDAGLEGATPLALREVASMMIAGAETREAEAKRAASRWTVAAVAAFGLASAAGAVAVAMSMQASDLRRSVTAMQEDAGEARRGLVESLREVATLRGDLATAEAVSDNAGESLRQADRHAATLLSRVEDLEAERDALACQLADLRTAILLDSDMLTAMTDTP